jgi:lipid-A-disaccharide synthase-like uncharacterized protein
LTLLATRGGMAKITRRIPMFQLYTALSDWLSAHWDWWVIIGLVGQTMFMMRFLLQWVASEKAGKSVMPEIFWYFSLAGGLIVLAYAIHKLDPVFILGQAMGTMIYLRNIHLIWREKRKMKT